MAYNTPGVYVEESLPQRTPIITAGTGVTAFFGFTKRGPAHTPVALNNFAQFKSAFGGSIAGETAEYALQGFFDNGGNKAYFVRLTAYDTTSGAESASASSLILDLDESTDNLKIEAGFRGVASPGLDGDNIEVLVALDSRHPSAGAGIDLPVAISPASTNIRVSGLVGLSAGSVIGLNDSNNGSMVFEYRVIRRAYSELDGGVVKHYLELDEPTDSGHTYAQATTTLKSIEYTITVFDNVGTQLEQWKQLSFGSDATGNVDLTINDPDLGSRYIKTTSTITNSMGVLDLSTHSQIALSGGTDEHSTFTSDMFAGSEIVGKGIHAIDRFTDVSLLCAPPTSQPSVNSWGVQADATYHSLMLEYAKGRMDCFAILDTAGDMSPAEVKTYREQTLGANSYWGAMYYPHLKIQDPNRPQSRATLTVPPSGHVAGVYSRVDGIPAPRGGVSATPAGINEFGSINGVIGIENNISDKQQATLNPIGVNCIRLLDRATGGKGIFIYGARTLSSDDNFKYVAMRRTMTFVEESVRLSTQFAIFQKNGPDLWQNVESIITTFLSEFWRNGNLAGDNQSDAFFVEVGGGTTSATDIENGILRGRIGISLFRPAEFIIFTFTQTQAGSAVEEG